MAQLTAKEKAEQINKFQKCSFVHPLTCGEEHCDGYMEAKTIPDTNGRDILIIQCPKCGWEQLEKCLPDLIFALDYEQMDRISQLFQKGDFNAINKMIEER